MSFARIRLIVALGLFVGWLGWLGLAVLQKDGPDRISRAQLTDANVLVAAEVSVGSDGQPTNPVRVVQLLSPTGPEPGQMLEIAVIGAAAPPGKPFPGSGIFLLPLVGDPAGKQFRIAGLPRSPGYERPRDPERPSIYPWSDATKSQLRSLGYNP